jgi:hypothetical protein
MEVLINNAKSSLQPEFDETLGHLFLRLDDYFNQQEETVISVTVDGNELSIEQQKIISEEKAQTYDKLDIEMIPTNRLPIKNIDDLKPLIASVPEVAESIAVNLQSGNIEQAMKDTDSLLQVWAILFQVISDSAKLLTFQLSEVTVGDSNFQNLTTDLSKHLIEIKEGLTHRDYVTVADIIEYEISPAVEKWLPALDVFNQFLEKNLADEPTG